jgi:hypothetical protein
VTERQGGQRERERETLHFTVINDGHDDDDDDDDKKKGNKI